MYTYGITGTSVDEFRDVTLTAVSDGQVLKWDSATSQWVNVDPSTLSIALDNLSDVTLTSPTEFQVLEYNGTSWVNQHASVSTLVRNVDTVTLGTGTAVYLFGATGDKASVKRADNDSDTTSSKVIGLVGTPILENEFGPVITRGYVDGIDLSVGYAPGDILYLGEDGGFTKVKPVAPEHTVFLGVVCRANNNGIVYVATQNGYELDELHDVKINGTLADNDVLQYDGATSVWKNEPAQDVVRNNQQSQGEPQGAADARFHGPNNTTVVALTSPVLIGGVMKIVFNEACTVTEVGVCLGATYGGATSYAFRLGLYEDGGTGDFPGALYEDLSTVTIATGATGGMKSLVLTAPLAVAAGDVLWTAVNCLHFGSPLPNVAYAAGISNPYAGYGLPATGGQSGAVAFTQNGNQTTAFADPYVQQANPTAGIAIVGYVKVTVP